MKVQGNITGINTGQLTGTSNTMKLDMNQVFQGRILSINGKIMEILAPNNTRITALIDGHMDLPVNVPISFKVIENTGDKIVLRPSFETTDTPIPAQRMLFELSQVLKLEPTPENINFLKDCEFNLTDNLKQLMDLLSADGREDIAQKVKDIFVTPEKITDYLKGFGKKHLTDILDKLDNVFNEIRNTTMHSDMYGHITGSIIKGLSLQTSHTFPLFFIPVPLIFENKCYPGEIWVEKDNRSEKSKGAIYMHLFMETSSMGRVEASILNSDSDMDITLFCESHAVPVFKAGLPDLKKRITSLGAHIKSIDVREIGKETNFISLFEKYLKPYPPVDIKA